MSSIKDIIEEFVDKLHAAIDGQASERARAAVIQAFGGVPPKRGPGRPPKALTAITPIALGPKTKRRKAPLQLCPVPGCKNPAAPVFGMVCSKHKDLPKRLIKKYREARKAKKLGVKAVAKAAKKAPKKSAERAIKKAPTTIAKKTPKASAKAIAKKAPKTSAKRTAKLTKPSKASKKTIAKKVTKAAKRPTASKALKGSKKPVTTEAPKVAAKPIASKGSTTVSDSGTVATSSSEAN